MKNSFILIMATLFFYNCATKKEILYLQDADDYHNSVIKYSTPSIQPNDILRITVGALEPEAAIPYNPAGIGNNNNGGNIQAMQLDGYLVSEDNMITFPELGEISTKNKTPSQLQEYINKLLVEGGHLNNPNVNVRILNAKVTVLGEVNSPGNYSFTEQNITILQALGYAGDLKISGKREDILVLRETDSLRQISHVDLTSAELLNSPFYRIRPNDVIIVDPNGPRVKSSGYIGNVGALLSVFSILLSTTILLTR